MKTILIALTAATLLYSTPVTAQTQQQLQNVANDLNAAADALKKAATDLVGPATTGTAPAHTTNLAPGANVQAALTAASCGDTLLLAVGAYPGSLTYSKTCPATTPVTIAGTSAPSTARLVLGTPQPKILPTPGANATVSATGSGLVLRGLDILGVLYGTVDVTGSHVTIEGCWIHGLPAGSYKRGVALNGLDIVVRNNVINDFHANGQDSQAVGGWLGAGQYVIDNNDLEAAGENIIFGGGDPTVQGLVPSNITITNNLITKPTSWRTNTENWNVKNLVELKNAAHVTISHNTLENSWHQAQDGFAIVLTPRNQDGGCPWCGVSDVTISENVVRHAASGISLLGTDDSHPSQVMTDIRVVGNLFYDINPQKWNDLSTGQWGSGRMIQSVTGPRNVTFAHNTMLGASLNSALTLGSFNDTLRSSGLVVRDNVFAEGEYGIPGDNVSGGAVALQLYAPGYVWQNNLMERGPSGANYNYPPTTTVGSAPVVDASFSVVSFSTLPTTDGKIIGANIPVLKAAISGLVLP